jgi:two-component sensor histidine kinase
MARIHDFLYANEQINEISLGEYVKDLATTVMSAMQTTSVSRVTARYNLTPVSISIRQAMPCGLIVNELLTNVFKYAYPNHDGGEIYFGVELTPDNRISLTVSDDGVGLPEGLDWQRSDSLGLRIIRILVNQLGGTVELNARQGVSFTVRFSRP